MSEAHGCDLIKRKIVFEFLKEKLSISSCLENENAEIFLNKIKNLIYANDFDESQTIKEYLQIFIYFFQIKCIYSFINFQSHALGSEQ